MVIFRSGYVPQTFDLIIMAYVTKVCQNPAFIVFDSQYPISFVQVHLGVPANSDSATAVKERVGKSKSYPAGTPRNDYDFHLLTYWLLLDSLSKRATKGGSRNFQLPFVPQVRAATSI